MQGIRASFILVQKQMRSSNSVCFNPEYFICRLVNRKNLRRVFLTKYTLVVGSVLNNSPNSSFTLLIYPCSSAIKKEIQSTGLLRCDGVSDWPNYKKETSSCLLFCLKRTTTRIYQQRKRELGELFKTLPTTNVYFVQERPFGKIFGSPTANKYSGLKQTELELRICFCTKMKEARIPLHPARYY